MQKITPCLSFDNNGEEAVNLYVSIFKNAEVLHLSRYGEAGPLPAGTMLIATIQLEGQQFQILNAGSFAKPTGAISLSVSCESQKEVDYLSEKLTAEGGEQMPCSWIKDKYEVYWQIVPSILGKLMSDPDKEKAGRVMKAMMQMKKIDIAKLQEAYEGK
jgi:predicted 3-demethylubiquinone-9 3-methyltransferase (glyoxalase superfamily)